MASTSNDTTNMECNDKEKHNSIYELRKNQQHHAGYYTVDGTIQHRQCVEMDTSMHHADEIMYEKVVDKFDKEEDDDVEEITKSPSEASDSTPTVTVTPIQQPMYDEKSE